MKNEKLGSWPAIIYFRRKNTSLEEDKLSLFTTLMRFPWWKSLLKAFQLTNLEKFLVPLSIDVLSKLLYYYFNRCYY